MRCGVYSELDRLGWEDHWNGREFGRFLGCGFRHVNRLRECEFQLCDPSRERRRGERFEELKFYVAILVGSIRVCELQFVIAKEWET